LPKEAVDGCDAAAPVCSGGTVPSREVLIRKPRFDVTESYVMSVNCCSLRFVRFRTTRLLGACEFATMFHVGILLLHLIGFRICNQREQIASAVK
jgi:hypothetical protein